MCLLGFVSYPSFLKRQGFSEHLYSILKQSLFTCCSFVHGVVYYLWIFMFCFNLHWNFLNETHNCLFTIKVDEYTCKGIESCSSNGSLVIIFIWKDVIQCQVMEDSQSKFCNRELFLACMGDREEVQSVPLTPALSKVTV